MPILKPESCKNCPFYTLSKYITPDAIVPESSILILAQNPGEQEELGKKITKYEYYNGKRVPVTVDVRPQPLIGTTGKWLQDEFWPLTRLDYSKVSKANVIKCRPYESNELPGISSNKPVHGITTSMLKDAVTYCTSTYLRIPSSVEYVLSMGTLSLYALTKETSITEWRGWCIGSEGLHHGTLYGIKDYYDASKSKLVKIFPVIHISSLFESDTLYEATLLDFKRFGNLVRNTWPLSPPEVKVNYVPTSIPSVIGFDTEYDPSDNNRLEMWSLADIQGNVYAVDAEVTSKLFNLPPKLTLVTQNGIVDLPHFMPLVKEYKSLDILMEDCMLAHSTLHTGQLNSLDYILSKYGLYNRHKHLRETIDKQQKYFYAGLDADTTLNSAWKYFVYEFKEDRLSYIEYRKRRQPLLEVITRFQERGVPVYKERVELITQILDEEMLKIIQRTRELTQNEKFNIASAQQVGRGLYENDFSEVPKKSAKSSTATLNKTRLQSIHDSSKKRVPRVSTQSLIDKLKAEFNIEG